MESVWLSPRWLQGLERRRVALAVLCVILLLLGTLGTIVWGLIRPWSSLEVEIPDRIDFGKVTPGVYEREFKIVNTSDRVVTVLDKKSSCGCATPSIKTPVKIAPHKSLPIKVRLDTNRLSGQAMKKIALLTDSEVEPLHVIRVAAFVERKRAPLLTPKVADLGRYGKWEEAVTEVRLLNRGTVDLAVQDLRPANSQLSIELARSDSAVCVIRVAVAPGSYDKPFRITQPIDTSQGPTQFEIVGQPQGDLYLSSNVITFHEGDGPEYRKSLELHHAPCIDIDAIDISTPGRTVTLESITRKDASVIRADLVMRPVAGIDATGRGVLTLRRRGGDVLLEVDYVILHSPKNAS